MATRRRGRPAHPDVLTPTEWAVLDQWRHGLSRAEIARRRAISAYGVRYHLRNIADKLGVVSSAELRHWRGAPMTSPLRRPVAATATATATDRANDRTNPATSERSPSMSISVPTADDGRASSGLALGQLGQVSLYVRDAAAAEAWYRDVLRLPEVFRFGDLVFFDCGGVRLYIHAVAEEKWRPSSVLYFLVPDIEAAHRELVARGIQATGAPHMIFKDDDTGTEEWMAFFEDPDANLLALMARVAPREPASDASARP